MKIRTFLINLFIISSSFIYAYAHAGSTFPEEEVSLHIIEDKPQRINSTSKGLQGLVNSSVEWAQQQLEIPKVQPISHTESELYKHKERYLNYSFDNHSLASVQNTNISRQTIGSGVKSSVVKADTPLQKNTREVTINARLSEASSSIVRENVQWTLYRTDSKQKIIGQVKAISAVQFTDSLAPGHYKITGQLDYAKGETSFKVPEGKGALKTITMPFKRAGQLKLTASFKKNGARIKQTLRWNVYRNGQEVHTETGRQMNYTAPAGTYTVRVSLGEATKEQKITIKKGRTANQVIALDAGTVHLMAINDKRSPVLSRINWSLKGQGATIEPTANRAARVVIPAGTYTANAKSTDGQNGKESFTIAAGESKRLKVLVR